MFIVQRDTLSTLAEHNLRNAALFSIGHFEKYCAGHDLDAPIEDMSLLLKDCFSGKQNP